MSDTATEPVRLELIRGIDADSAALSYDGQFLAWLPLRPAWRSSNPLANVLRVLDRMSPKPEMVYGARSEGTLGSYCAPLDRITLYQDRLQSEEEAAVVALHELLHSTGHASRLARPYYEGCEKILTAHPNLNPDDFTAPWPSFEQLPLPVRQEETCVRLATAHLSTRLGVMHGSIDTGYLLQQLATLPKCNLLEAIRDAERAASYLLP